MTAVATLHNTVYLTGLAPEDVRAVREDFHQYPFPDWRVDVLDVGSPLPVDLAAGQSILVIGCGGPPPAHAEAMWLLRLLACGCPWLAVGSGAESPVQELCEAAGAAAFLPRPFSPAKLREMVWHNAIPSSGKSGLQPLTCERMLRFFAAVGPTVALNYQTEHGRTGTLVLVGGQPVFAAVQGGPDGPEALREIMGWGKGKVVGRPVPPNLKPNLPERPEAWVQLMRPPPPSDRIPAPKPVPGGRDVCDRVLQTLPDAVFCALFDLRSGQLTTSAARDTGLPGVVGECEAAGAMLRSPFKPFDDSDGPGDPIEEIFVSGRNEWWGAARVGVGALALIVIATGRANLGLARHTFATATAELRYGSGMIVADSDPS